MVELLVQPPRDDVPAALPLVVDGDERAGREDLRKQIARLERELADAMLDIRPGELPPGVVRGRGARLLDLGELEGVRDRLALRLGDVRGQIIARAEREAEKRLLVEKMLLDPGEYRWVRVTGEDVGERLCKSWHVRPRLGIVGMLAGWWHVKVSSGCPLATGPRLRRGPPAPAA